MAVKHTPGPWSHWLNDGKASKFGITGPGAANAMVARRAIEEAKHFRNEAGMCAEIPSASQVCVALALGDTQKEVEANTRLIAAAPELLQKLLEIVDVYDDGNRPYDERAYIGGTLDLCVKEARALIAKATGGDE